MNREEAKLFLNAPEGISIGDFFEEQLFTYKQFFLSKTPIHKVFLAKLDKLAKEDEAYHVLTTEKWRSYSLLENDFPEFSNEVLVSFNQFESQKTRFKMRLMQAVSGEDIYYAVTDYLRIVKAYRNKWCLIDIKESIFEGTVSKDPDPMDLLHAIREFNNKGGVEFQDVLKIEENSFLLNEMKRLSLLIKKYGG